MKPDMTCMPYKRKKLYLLLTVPLLALFGSIFVYLWIINPVLGLLFVGFYLGICIFQSYCCACQDCPYIGIRQFCPGILGIVPSSWIAKLPFIRQAKKSKTAFELSAAIGSLFILAFLIFPLIWLIELGINVTIAYIGFIVIYLVLFVWNICPACATRYTCPAGKISNAMHRMN